MLIIADSQLVKRTQHSLRLLGSPSNEDDIMIYTKSRLGKILKEDQIVQVSARADGIFIWASAASNFIIKGRPPSKAFANLMQSTLSERPLDDLYTTILADACKHIGRNDLPEFIEVVRLICVAQEPLDVKSIDELLHLGSDSEDSVSGSFVECLSSVLSDGRDQQPVQALHPTFIEFVLRWQWQDQKVIDAEDKESLRVQSRDAEALVAQSCLRILSHKLKYNILDVIQPKAFAPLNEEIQDLEERIQNKTTNGLRYAAVYALSHVAFSLTKDIAGKLREIFEKKLLFWIELMSYLGNIYPLLHSVHFLLKRMKEFMASERDNWVSE